MKCPKCQNENPEDTLYCGKCGTQLPSLKEVSAPTKTLEAAKEELTTGSTFADRYQIIEELGKGGMGKVYKVMDTKIKEKIALKLLKPEIASDKNTIERFSNELKFSRKIRHENVCQMYDLNEEKGTHYITMEYIHGEDLKRLIRKMGQMSAGQAISLAKQMCEGLAEAHKLGIVHRDLKPHNIMVDEEGKARVMDFGIARSLKGKGMTGAGVMIGTPEYMSPEQVEGKDVDQRSDIYSLGVILYEMVTGRVPFEGDTAFTIGVKQKSELPQEPGELNSQVPSDLSGVIMKCLEKDKNKRYQSAGEVRSELIAIEKGIPTTERIIPERKPITSREITVTFGLKKLFIPALVVVAVIIAAVVIWQILPKKEAVHIPAGKPSLAIMYFKNNTGDKNLDTWRTALSDSLITDLSQSRHIRVLSGDRLYSILKQMNLLEAKSYSTEDLKKVASQGRANHIIQGNLSKAGDNFRIEITIQEANSMELIGSERAEGIGEESIFPMIDELTTRIKTNFKLTAAEIDQDIDKKVEEITTKSPEAYKLYTQARKHHYEGNYYKSIGLMEKVIAIDPEFAMAYRSEAMSFGSLGFLPAKEKNLKKAYELSARASERERYLIEGDFYSQSEKTYGKAIETYDKLLDLYPDDLRGHNNLAVRYIGFEEWDKAIEHLEICRKDKIEFWGSYASLGGTYEAKGMYTEAQEVYNDYLLDFSDNFRIRNELAINLICQGEYDLALEEVEKIIPQLPIQYQSPHYVKIKGDIHLFKGDLIQAEREYQKILKIEEEGRKSINILYLLQGNFKELINQLQAKAAFRAYPYTYIRYGDVQKAMDECNKLWNEAFKEEKFSAQIRILHYKGLIYLKMKSLDEAKRTADELKELIQSGMSKKKIRLYHHLIGLIELERKNFSEAIKNFKACLSYMFSQKSLADNHALFIEPLAQAYYKAGDLDNAREQYEKITKLTTGRLYYGDTYVKSFYTLGKIYEKKGNQSRAIGHYEKFLDLWKNADPGIAEVEEARKKLAELKR